MIGLKTIRLALLGLCMLFFLTACGTERTSNRTEQATKIYSKNQLIFYYESIKLKEALESSINKQVFKKHGQPNGYELTLSQERKEAILIIRPASEKKFSSLKTSLEQKMEDVLQKENVADYSVKVMPLWNDTNRTSRQIQEEDMIRPLVQEMKQKHQTDAVLEPSYSAADGRITGFTVSFQVNGAVLTDPYQLNYYTKEFTQLVREKGFNMDDLTIYFMEEGNEDWKKKIISAIDKGLKEIDELQVTSVTMVDASDPIIINTSVNSTDSAAKKTGQRIEELVQDFLQYEEIKSVFPASFTIEVQSADQIKLN